MRKWMTALAVSAAATTIPVEQAPAQSGAGAIEGRVGRLESEMRAVQRKVFPGGSAAMLEPQINSAAPAATPNGSPASAPLADLNARVTSLEQQIATVTGQVEQTQYRLRQLEDQFAAYRKSTDAKLSAAPSPAAPGGLRADETGDTASRPTRVTTPRGTAAEPARTSAPATTVAGIDRPDTGDAAEDGYTYGYRLWAAKRYPEAEAQLKKVVADFPKHRRANFAQNLLGRSYLDEGKPSLASIAFYDNYKKYPDGERAPDSLFYLGSALTKLNKPADACKVYGELIDVYDAKISASMRADVARARAAAKCK